MIEIKDRKLKIGKFVPGGDNSITREEIEQVLKQLPLLLSKKTDLIENYNKETNKQDHNVWWPLLETPELVEEQQKLLEEAAGSMHHHHHHHGTSKTALTINKEEFENVHFHSDESGSYLYIYKGDEEQVGDYCILITDHGFRLYEYIKEDAVRKITKEGWYEVTDEKKQADVLRAVKDGKDQLMPLIPKKDSSGSDATADKGLANSKYEQFLTALNGEGLELLPPSVELVIGKARFRKIRFAEDDEDDDEEKANDDEEKEGKKIPCLYIGRGSYEEPEEGDYRIIQSGEGFLIEKWEVNDLGGMGKSEGWNSDIDYDVKQAVLVQVNTNAEKIKEQHPLDAPDTSAGSAGSAAPDPIEQRHRVFYEYILNGNLELPKKEIDLKVGDNPMKACLGDTNG
jgi:hypothetical protein